MAIKLGSIVVDFLANTAGFQTGLSKASYEAKKTAKEIHGAFGEMGSKIGESFKEVLGQFGPLGQAFSSLGGAVNELGGIMSSGGSAIAGCALAVGALAAAGTAAAVGLAELAKGGGEVVEQFEHLSQKTGIAANTLVAWKAVAEASGSSLDSFETGVRKLEKAMGGSNAAAKEAQHVMASIGVTAKDPQEALVQIADAFQRMPDGAQKAAVAIALFGKSGTDMIPILDKGSQEIERWQTIAKQMGPDISEGAVKAAEDWKAKTVELGLAWDKFKVSLSKDVLPVLTQVAGAFEKIAAARGGGSAYDLTPEEFAKQGDKAPDIKAIGDANKVFNDAMTKRAQDAIDGAQKLFDLTKARGPEEAKLVELEKEITEALKTGTAESLNRAASLEAELPTQKKLADLEMRRRVEAERLADAHAKDMAAIGKDVHPFQKSKPFDQTKGIEALFGPQEKNPNEGAPDLGTPAFLTDMNKIPDLAKKSVDVGGQYVTQFYADWDRKSQGNAASINLDYDKQLAHLQGMLALGEVSQKQAEDVFMKIQQERYDGLKRLRQENGESTFGDAWQDMFANIQKSGKNFSASLVEDIGGAIDQLNNQLATFVATGKGLDVKKIGEGLTQSITSSILKKGESSLLGSLGLGNTKMDGSDAAHATFVQFANGGGIGTNDPNNPLGSLTSLFDNSGGGGGGISRMLQSQGSGVGNIFSTLLSFLPGFADGGDVQPGKAYVVGEKRPELFMPRSAGTIVPNVPSSSTNVNNTTIHQHIYGVQDADSFKKSQSQISSAMGSAVSRGQQRNGR